MYPVGNGKLYKSKTAAKKALKKYFEENPNTIDGISNAKILCADNCMKNKRGGGIDV